MYAYVKGRQCWNGSRLSTISHLEELRTRKVGSISRSRISLSYANLLRSSTPLSSDPQIHTLLSSTLQLANHSPWSLSSCHIITVHTPLASLVKSPHQISTPFARNSNFIASVKILCIKICFACHNKLKGANNSNECLHRRLPILVKQRCRNKALEELQLVKSV